MRRVRGNGLLNRYARVLLVLCVVMLFASCTASRLGTGSYVNGQQQVVELANATLALIPQDAAFVPRRVLTLADADRELCHKKFAGFAYSELNAQQPEVTAFAELPKSANAQAVLASIETAWRARQYDVDTRGLSDAGFPQLHARIGEYQLVVTSFSQTGGFANKPRVSVYAVGRCLNA